MSFVINVILFLNWICIFNTKLDVNILKIIRSKYRHIGTGIDYQKPEIELYISSKNLGNYEFDKLEIITTMEIYKLFIRYDITSNGTFTITTRKLFRR